MVSILTQTPLISVVMPAYNAGPYIAEAINSVLVQTYTSWELIVVDDGSSDHTGEIARHYAAHLPAKIRYITHEQRKNLGVSASRNVGSKLSRGSYVACLDSDDVWLPDKLETQVRILQEYSGIGMIIGATKYWYPQCSSLNRVVPVGGVQDCVADPPSLFAELYPIGSGAAPSMNTVLLKKDVITRVGGWEETFRTSYEDQAMLCKVYLSEPVYISSKTCDLYRQHAFSIMSTELAGEGYYRNRYTFLRWLEGWLRHQPTTRTRELKLVRHALRDPSLWRYSSPNAYVATRTVKKLCRVLSRLRGP